MPFNTFVFKISSLCNLNCSHCYVYNRGDESWRNQPPRILLDVIDNATSKIGTYLNKRRSNIPVTIGLHGGEPLLVGEEYFEKIVKRIINGLKRFNVVYSITLISNGTLFNKQFGDLLRRYNVSIFVSCDETPSSNIATRVDKEGIPSVRKLENKLSMLASEYNDIFSGFQVVVNPSVDPIELYDYLSYFKPSIINYLLPLYNHESFPSKNSGIYGKWLVESFDWWLKNEKNVIRIRFFDKIISILLKLGKATTDGLGYADAVTIESDGKYETDDTLKTTNLGAALNLNVFEHNLDDVLNHPKVKMIQNGSKTLHQKCKNCSLLSVCGGGHITHRYSKRNDFCSPSVFCEDIKIIVSHIANRLRREIILGIDI